MNTDAFTQIQEGLSQAVSPTLSPDELTLLRRRITKESNLPPMEFLFRMFGVSCFPRRELVAVAGKAKSGKTLFLSLLMASAMRQETLGITREKEQPLKVMWFDTEQSEQSTQDILVNRIIPLADTNGQQITMNDQFFAFNTRGMGWKERKHLFLTGVHYVKPDFVVLDGVRDLISDINDGVEAMQVTEILMQTAQDFNCCIVCVLHQNKSDSDRNLRGWIGTELTNKVFEVYVCEKLKEHATFKVEQTHSRKYEIGRDLYYVISPETNLPESANKPMEQPRDAQGRFMSPNKSSNLRKVFEEALEGRHCRLYNEVMGIVMKRSGIQYKEQYYEMFNEAINLGIIRKETTGTGSQYVTLCDNELPF